jgi:tetratricopeptide (TPR) repeat protein
VLAAAPAASGQALRLAAVLERLTSADAADWLLTGDMLRLGGENAEAVRAYERSLAIQADTREALLGKAESLRVLAQDDALREAMAIYRRVAAGDGMSTDAEHRDYVWWLCQLRQLQVLQAAGRFDDRASMRLNRLRTVDPELGGPAFAPAFELLSAGDPGSVAGLDGVDR